VFTESARILSGLRFEKSLLVIFSIIQENLLKAPKIH
jgi:hypothetical protein